ncbi:uncharacterized protein LOC134935487 [Pseudophryne corroboree]|uniref:uncharacterized protein LOC134935487 n=1 Tax=Pseudophryne corroboree TaxID=495146 RepID=UPI0030821334
MKIAAFFIVILGLANADGEAGTAQPPTGKPLSSDKANGCAYLFSSCNHFYNIYKASPQNEKPEKMKCVVDILLQIVGALASHINISVPDFLSCMGISSTAVNAYKTGDMNGFYGSISVDLFYNTVQTSLKIIFAVGDKILEDVIASVNSDLGITPDEDCNCPGNSPTEILEKYKNSLLGGLLTGLFQVADGVVTGLGGVVDTLNNILSGSGNNVGGVVDDLGKTVSGLVNNLGDTLGNAGKTVSSVVNTAVNAVEGTVGTVGKALSDKTNTGNTGILTDLGL